MNDLNDLRKQAEAIDEVLRAIDEVPIDAWNIQARLHQLVGKKREWTWTVTWTSEKSNMSRTSYDQRSEARKQFLQAVIDGIYKTYENPNNDSEYDK